MEPWLHQRLQIHGHHRLSDPVCDRRHAEHSDPGAVRLGDLDRPDRGRKVGPRAHPIPDLVEVVPQDRPRTPPGPAHPLPGHPCWPQPAGTPPRPSTWESQTACPWALACSPRFLPGLTPRLIESTFLVSRPLGSTPTPASSGFTATTGRSASERRVGTQCLRFLPRHAPSRDLGGLRPRSPYRRSPSHVPCKSRRPGSRRLYAGHHLARTRAPARLIPRSNPRPPVSMPSERISTPQQRTPAGTSRPSASGTSSWSPPDAIKRAVSLSLTTTVFSQRSTGWFERLPP